MTNAQVQFAPQTQTAEAHTPQIALLPPPVHDETARAHSESRNTQHATRIDPSATQNPASVHRPSAALTPRTRNGKVARLPFPQRDMVNRMLRNNIPHSRIAGALDEHGIKVTERNISNWKTRGGYRDWCTEQDCALENRLLQDNLIDHLRTTDASQLPEVGLQLAATQLSRFFLQPNVEQQLASDPTQHTRTIGILCRLARQIHTLQKYRDDAAKELGPQYNPERIKRETEEALESTRNTYSSFIPENAPIDPEVPHRNFIPKNGFQL